MNLTVYDPKEVEEMISLAVRKAKAEQLKEVLRIHADSFSYGSFRTILRVLLRQIEAKTK